MSRHAQATGCADVRIEALDTDERAIAVELRILHDIVEVKVGDYRKGTIQRSVLRAWFWMPFSLLEIGDVTFRPDPTNANRARITIEARPELAPWPISPMDDQRLREAL
jgi:hypothetical protein